MNKIVRYILIIWVLVLGISVSLFNTLYGMVTPLILVIIAVGSFIAIASISVYSLVKEKYNWQNFVSTILVFLTALFNNLYISTITLRITENATPFVADLVRSIWYLIPIGYYIYKHKRFNLDKKIDMRFTALVAVFLVSTLLTLLLAK